MIIRFENHLFYRLWGKGHREQFDQYFKFDAKKHWLGHNFRADPKESSRRSTPARPANGKFSSLRENLMRKLPCKASRWAWPKS